MIYRVFFYMLGDSDIKLIVNVTAVIEDDAQVIALKKLDDAGLNSADCELDTIEEY